MGRRSFWDVQGVGDSSSETPAAQAAKAAAGSPKELNFAQNPPKAGASGLGDAVSGAQMRREVKGGIWPC